MNSSDFRARAREALNGNWLIAAVTTLVAGFLGGGGSAGGVFKSNYSLTEEDLSNFSESVSGLSPEINAVLAIALFAVMWAAVMAAVLYIVLGGAVNAGLCRFNQNMYHRTGAKFKDLFFHFGNFGKLFIANFLMSLYIFLWLLLFIIPGFIAAYSYSMTFFILDENPEMKASEALRASKEMMKGQKLRLFYLQLSFIGWYLLGVLSLGIAFLFISPYIKAATCAFYNELAHKSPEHGATELPEAFTRNEA